MGRYLDSIAPPGDPDVRAVDISYSLDRVFAADHANVFALPSLDGLRFPSDGWYSQEEPAMRAAFEAIASEERAAGSVARALADGGLSFSRNVDRFAGIPDSSFATFPDTSIATALRTVARMMHASSAGDISAGIYQVGIDGFDTHARQESGNWTHSGLWTDLSAALDAFQSDITQRGLAGDTLVVLYSEFGRRVEENGSRGTDHGTAAPMLVLGNPVLGGVYGDPANLTDLDDDDNLKHDIDFRSVYATLLARWLDHDPESILGAGFAEVPFLP
jgi:uncharacterized protein (DUF1501 family)